MVEIPVEIVCADCSAELVGAVDPLTYKTEIKVEPCQRCATVPTCVSCGEELEGRLCEDCGKPAEDEFGDL